MPRFPQADEAFLKRTMLPRAPDYFYKPEDIELITKETGMEESRAQHWAANLRWKAGINKLPGGMSMEEFLKTSPDLLSEKMEKIYVKRCYVSMFNADQNLVENFSIPKSRGSGDFSIQYLYFAWNPETFVAEGFMDFNDQIWTTTIHDRLAELGARSIEVMTFQNNDNNHSAASALSRVISVAKTAGFKEVIRGNCNPKLASKMYEIKAQEESDKKAKNAEFDEKTQAAIKLSLEMTEEIKSNMATKEGLSHLEEITQTSAKEVKLSFVKIDESYKENIIRQAAIIEAQQDANAKLNHHLITMDRKMMEKDEKIHSQAYIISKLNADVRQKEEKISQFHSVIEKKNQVILNLTAKKAAVNHGDAVKEVCTSIMDHFKEALVEFKAGMKRKHDE